MLLAVKMILHWISASIILSRVYFNILLQSPLTRGLKKAFDNVFLFYYESYNLKCLKIKFYPK